MERVQQRFHRNFQKSWCIEQVQPPAVRASLTSPVVKTALLRYSRAAAEPGTQRDELAGLATFTL